MKDMLPIVNKLHTSHLIPLASNLEKPVGEVVTVEISATLVIITVNKN